MTFDMLLAGSEIPPAIAQFADAMPHLVWIADSAGTVLYYNHRVAEFAGAARQPDGHWRWEGLLHHDDLEPTLEAWRNAVRHGRVYEKEHRVQMRDGAYRWHLSRAFPQRNADGAITQWVGTATDIHEQKTATERIREREAQLQQTQATLALAISAGSIGIWTHDVAAGRITWSSEQEAIHGLAPGTFGGTYADWRGLVHPDDIERVEATYRRIFLEERREEASVEFRIIRPDNGAVRWMLSKARALTDESGQITRASGINVDITAQKEAQESLSYQRNVLQTVAQNTEMALFLMNEHHVCVYMNEAAEKMTGFKLEELQGKPLHDYVHHTRPDGRHYPMHECSIYQALLEHTRNQGEEVFVHRDGRFYPVAYTASPIVLDGVPIGTVLEVRDTTEEKVAAEQEKRSRAALEESEQRFRTLAESLPQLVWMTTIEGRLDYASPRWQEYSGLVASGESWKAMVHPDEFEGIMEIWRVHSASGEPYRAEVRLRNRHGDYRWHDLQGRPVRNAEGAIITWIGGMTDIHDQKTAHEQLEQIVAERTAELRHVVEALEEKNRQLQEVNKELESFNYMASHDLQEPLRKIQTFVSLIRHKRSDPAVLEQSFEKIQAAAQRMSELTADIMTYSRLNRNGEQFVATDLNAVLQRVMADFELLIDEKNAVVEAAPLPIIRANPRQMSQLFLNLLSNGLKFSGPAPVVRILATETSGEALADRFPAVPGRQYAVLEFRDNGIGFDPQFAERIFGLFTRLHNREDYPGTGIGLAICKKIVEHHEGFIAAEGNLGEGAIFRVYLPK